MCEEELCGSVGETAGWLVEGSALSAVLIFAAWWCLDRLADVNDCVSWEEKPRNLCQV